jgi:hypothetical protein
MAMTKHEYAASIKRYLLECGYSEEDAQTAANDLSAVRREGEDDWFRHAQEWISGYDASMEHA